MKVVYQGGDNLYVPIDQMDKVQKYIGVVEEKHDKKWYNPHNNQRIFEIFLAEMTKSHESLYKKGGQRK